MVCRRYRVSRYFAQQANLRGTSLEFLLVRNQPIEAVHNNELNLTLLGFEIQTELLPKCGKDRVREAIGCG